MFTLKKDIPQLYQWDSNVKLIVEYDRINQVQFSQRFSQTAVCVKVENKECFIPNEFLQSYYDIFAYACIVDNDGQVCEFSDMFSVFARPKPDNYVYTPTEILTLKHIEDELNKKFEALAKEIEDDMETAVRTRPQELTEEEKSQARKNIGAISSEEDRGAYYVTITEDENGYISDRTFDDISYSLNNNLFPYAKYDLNVYPLVSSSDGTLTFGGVLGKSFTEIKIMPDNSISINNHNYSPDWEAQEYDDGFIKNRTHGKIIYKCDTEEKVPTSMSGARELTDAQETYLQSIGANTKSSKELSFVLPGYDVSYDRMSNEYDYDNYEPPNESNTKIQIAIQDSSGIMTAMPSFTVSEIKANDILYGWSFNFTDGGFAENYLKCIVMLLKHVPYNGHIQKGIWLPNYTGSPKKGYACKIEYTCIKKLEKTYIPDLGNSLPDGGTTGQVLTKNSNADGDARWKDSSGSEFSDDGSGNISVNGASSDAKRFLNSLTVPGLNYKYVNPINSGTYTSPYGVYITSGTVIDYVVGLTQVGFYTAYVNRRVTDIPDAAKDANSSLRGFVCVSQVDNTASGGSTKCYAYIVLIDQNSNFYIQYIQGSIGGGWKRMYPYETAESALIEKLDKNQGSANSGKFLRIGADGIVVPTKVGGGSEWATLFNGTITTEEAVNSMSADLLKSCEGMNEFLVWYTNTKNTVETPGNDNSEVTIGKANYGYGRFGDLTSDNEKIVHLLLTDSITYSYVIDTRGNSMQFNTGTGTGGWSSNKANPDYNKVKIACFSGTYIGTISLKIYGR